MDVTRRSPARPPAALRRLLLALALVLPAAAPTSPACGLTPEQRLARQLAADVVVLVAQQPLRLEVLDIAVMLLEEATALDPEAADLWRVLLDLGELTEREDLQARAIERIAALDPDDQVIRWRQATLELAAHQTAAERIDACRRLLEPERRRRLGNAVASRLALDLALLYHRQGDELAFRQWLAEATTWDSGNRAAAALAAGYFGRQSDDPAGRLELLLNLLLADPVDLTTQLEIARLLMENGAYAGAERVLRMASGEGRMPLEGEGASVYADLALSQWAQGRPEVALTTIDRLQRRADQAYRDEVRRQQPGLTAMDLAHLRAPMAASVTTVRAAIHALQGDEDAASSLQRTDDAYATAIRDLESADPPEPERLAELYLERAWVLVMLGGEVSYVREWLDRAQAHRPLLEAARRRFEGWIAWREGRLADARTALEPVAEGDLAARLGLAMVLVDEGAGKPAARELLAVARTRPGSVLGVWAAEKLFELLGGTRAAILPQAETLEQLAASIPRQFDRYLGDPSLCVSLSVSATKATYDAYAPIMVDLELRNNSSYPIAIDPDGPIRPQVLLEVTARVAQARAIDTLQPIVVDIDRRLTLKPRERLVVPIDLSWRGVSRILNQVPTMGASLQVEAITNFGMSPRGAMVLRPLGQRAKSRPFRIDGVRFSRDWVEDMMSDLVGRDRLRDIRAVALLSHLAGAGLAADLPPADQELFASALASIAEGFARLDPISQAWLLAVIRKGESASELLAIARKSDHRLVKMIYLVYCTQGVNDPMINAARRDPDPRVRQLAEMTLEAVQRILAEQRNRVEIGRGSGG